MKLKITLLAVFTATFFMNAQVAPTLHHNNLDVNNTSDGPLDIAIYNNEMYMSMAEDGKIVKISLATPNAPVVDVLTGLSFPTGLAVVGTELYYLQGANALFMPNTGSLSKISLTTTPVPTPVAVGLQYPVELAMNGTVAYIAETFLDTDQDVDHMQVSVLNGAVKTVLNSSFDYVDDIEYYSNALYIMNYNDTTNLTTIARLNLLNNPAGTLQPFWTDTNDLYPYKMALSGTKMYMNVDSSPASIYQLDILNPSAAPVQVVSPFLFNGNTAYVNEMIMAPGNILYNIGESYDMGLQRDHYLLYRADLSTLGNKEFETVKNMVYPNPATNLLSIANYDNGNGFSIYSVEGKQVMAGQYNGSINVSGLSTGMYILKLDNGTSVKVQKN